MIKRTWTPARGGAELHHANGAVAARVVAQRFIGVFHDDGRQIRAEASLLSATTLRSIALRDLELAGYPVEPVIQPYDEAEYWVRQAEQDRTQAAIDMAQRRVFGHPSLQARLEAVIERRRKEPLRLVQYAAEHGLGLDFNATDTAALWAAIQRLTNP